MQTRISPRRQGDIGERSALSWLIDQGADVYLPFGHSPDIDLIANFGVRGLSRVQVKTSTVFQKRRWVVTLATRGGNQSWSGLVKHFSAERCDHLFVLVADGRRWFIPGCGRGRKLRTRAWRAEIRRVRGRTRPPVRGGSGGLIARLRAPRRGTRAVKGTRL
jgi:hypothetical protein